MNIIEILASLFFLLIASIFLKIVFRMKGNKTKDEMFLFFLNRAFRNVGVVLFLVAGLSIIVSYSRLVVFNDNVSLVESRNIFVNDLKYFATGCLAYLYTYISFRNEMKKLDQTSHREEEQ